MNYDWLGENEVYTDAHEFERVCLNEPGALVLCATSRLARRLLHLFRLKMMRGGTAGWETPNIRSLSGWVRERYVSGWHEKRPLSSVAACRLWRQALAGLPVPNGLIITTSFYDQLQYSLEVLMDGDLDPCGATTGHVLADFRRLVSLRFIRLLAEEELAPEADIYEAVRVDVESGSLSISNYPKVVLAGFDLISPLKLKFLQTLAARVKVVSLRAESELRADTQVRVYASPEQECMTVCAEVLACWNSGVKDIGVVTLDPDYFRMVKLCLDELAGEDRPEFESAIRYNLTRGEPLAEHPLFQTAILPLKFAVKPDDSALIVSLLQSPYLEKKGEDWDVSTRSVFWDAERPESPRAALAAAHEIFSASGVLSLCDMGKTKVEGWRSALSRCWREMGFPRFDGMSRTKDVLALRHLEEALDELLRDAGNVLVDCADFLAWLTVIAGKIIVSEKTSETVGIQVLTADESRGLSFSKLWVVGVHGQVLPGQADDFPLLDPDERKALKGGNAESRWELARRRLAGLLAAAPETSFSRSASNGDDDPYLPCPFLSDELGDDGKPFERVLNVWRDPPREWSRAVWLWKSRMEQVEPEVIPEDVFKRVDECVGSEISVTAFSDLTSCPFMFFCKYVLRLNPLKAPSIGLDPQQRGRVIHSVLKNIVDQLCGVAGWADDEERAFKLIKEIAERELSKQSEDLFWRVERARLVGDHGIPGVLQAWLRAELDMARDNWMFAGTELVFKALDVAGVKLRGRIDRVDYHKEKGFAVWDYKTGDPPPDRFIVEFFTEPQLPAYLLALRNGLVNGLCRGPVNNGVADIPLHMGYIKFKTAADTRMRLIRKGRRAFDFDEWLPLWEKALVSRTDQPRKGVYPAEPVPAPKGWCDNSVTACSFCEFFNICGYFDSAENAMPDEDSDENEEMNEGCS